MTTPTEDNYLEAIFTHVEQLEQEITRLREELDTYKGDDRHQIELRDDGFTIQHPMACRPHLFDCTFNYAGRVLHPRAFANGRYWVEIEDGWLVIGEQVTP